jgi:hypothetical protein
MQQLINKHPNASLYQTHYRYIDKDGITTRHSLPMDEFQHSFEFLALQMTHTIDSTGTGYMMRSADFENAGGMPLNYPNLIFSDYELWIRLGRKSYKATALDECFRYRQHLSVSRITNGELYQAAFEEYVKFMKQLKDEEDKFAEVITRYGKHMLLYFCESLSHRLLKTPISERSLRVKDLVKKFHGYAKTLIPGESFDPMAISGIKYAVFLDGHSLTRMTFKLLNRYRKRW